MYIYIDIYIYIFIYIYIYIYIYMYIYIYIYMKIYNTALLERRPNICHVKITFGLLLINWFVSTKRNSMKHFVS